MEIVFTSVVAGLLVYLIQKIDDLAEKIDQRLDLVENRITKIEAIFPKRKSDTYYSPNSGIEL